MPTANMAPTVLKLPNGAYWAGADSGNVTGRYAIGVKASGANTFLSGSAAYAIWTDGSKATGEYADGSGGSGPYYQLTADTWLVGTNDGPAIGRINPDGSWTTVTTKQLPMDNPWMSWVYSPYREELLYIGSDYAHGNRARAFTATVGSDSIGNVVTRNGIQQWYETNNVNTSDTYHPVAVDKDSYLLFARNGLGYLVNVTAGSVARHNIGWGVIDSDDNYDAYPYGAGKVLLRKGSTWGNNGPESAVYAVLDVASGTMARLSMPTAPDGWSFTDVWGSGNSLVDVFMLPNNEPVLCKYAMMTNDDHSAWMIYFQVNDDVYYGGSATDTTPFDDGMFGPPGTPFFQTGGFGNQTYIGVMSFAGQFVPVTEVYADNNYLALWVPQAKLWTGATKRAFTG